MTDLNFTSAQVADFEALRKRMPLNMKGRPLDEWVAEMVDRAFDAMAEDEQVYDYEEEGE